DGPQHRRREAGPPRRGADRDACRAQPLLQEGAARGDHGLGEARVPGELAGKQEDLALPASPLPARRDVDDTRRGGAHRPSESGKSGQRASSKAETVARTAMRGTLSLPAFTVPSNGAP